jgi:hypothetical protein
MKSISDLVASLRVARSTITDLDARLAKLAEERTRIEAMPPHADDIADCLARGLDSYGELFKERMRWFLNPENLRVPGSYLQLVNPSPLLELPDSRPAYCGLLPGGAFGLGSRDAAACAVAFAVAPLMRERLPALVAELLPESKSGMRAAERFAKLAAIDREAEQIEAQRSELMEQLAAARDAASSA